MSKVSVVKLKKMKEEGNPVVWVTAYSYPFAKAAEVAGMDMILVGDSGGMVELGYDNTHPVTMDEMIQMARAVRRGAPNSFVIGDMPQGSYEVSDWEAVRNALRFVKEAGCDAVKLEGGSRVCDRVRAICNAGILVMGHLGLTPQSTESFGGYRVQGKTRESLDQILKDARSLGYAGVFSILLEAMPEYSAEVVAKISKVPIYGIGAGSKVDGQLLIMHDLVGLYTSFRPKFAKCFVSDVGKQYSFDGVNGVGYDGVFGLVVEALKKYRIDVISGEFPKSEHIYPISEEELLELRQNFA